jgi:hypothetical protein
MLRPRLEQNLGMFRLNGNAHNAQLPRTASQPPSDELNHMKKADHIHGSVDAARRDLLKMMGLFAAGTNFFWPEALFQKLAMADEQKSPAEDTAIGRREIIMGLDGMSRVADPGNDPFVSGHNAAAVISSAFFCRNEKLEEDTQKEILSLIKARLLTSPIYAPLPEETADQELVGHLVKDLDAGINTLRLSGHNIIFAVISLKALVAVPEAATPARVNGLRKMVQSFGPRGGGKVPLQNKDSFADLSDEQQFIRFIFEEYLKALELYLNGKGHHGFAGHVLTIGHALVELDRMGHKETARKGVEAYWQFVQQARNGADLGGKKVQDPPQPHLSVLARDYWSEQGKRQSREVVSSHLIKYPYSFYALAKEVRDDDLKKRIFERLYHLTAVS